MLSPLPFGSVYPLASAALAIVVGLNLMTWGARAVLDPTAVAVGFDTTWPLLLLFSLVITAALLQSSPLTPLAWHAPLWHQATAALGTNDRGAISLDPQVTIEGIVRLCTFAGIFWLALQAGRESRLSRHAIQAIGIAATSYACYGLIEHLSGDKHILWWPKRAYLGDVTATFVNRNNFATYAGLGWLCVLASLYRSYGHWVEGISNPTERLRTTLKFFERRGWIYAVALLIIAAALFASRSRGGLMATLCGLLVFCTALYLQRRGDKRLARHFTLASLTVAVIFFLAGGRLVEERLAATNSEADERILIYALTEEAIADHPWRGTGLGTFEAAFSSYRLPSMATTYAQAHNTYLELMLELGIPAAALLLLTILLIVARNYRGALKRRRDSVYPSLGLGATALVGSHAMVDFSIQIPAIAATYALILGVAMAQSRSRPTVPSMTGMPPAEDRP